MNGEGGVYPVAWWEIVLGWSRMILTGVKVRCASDLAVLIFRETYNDGDWQAMRLRVCALLEVLCWPFSEAIRCHHLVRSYSSLTGGTKKWITGEHDTGSGPIDGM